MINNMQALFTGEQGDYRYSITLSNFSDECLIELHDKLSDQNLTITLGDLPHLRTIFEEFENLKKETSLEV